MYITSWRLQDKADFRYQIGSFEIFPVSLANQWSLLLWFLPVRNSKYLPVSFIKQIRWGLSWVSHWADLMSKFFKERALLAMNRLFSLRYSKAIFIPQVFIDFKTGLLLVKQRAKDEKIFQRRLFRWISQNFQSNVYRMNCKVRNWFSMAAVIRNRANTMAKEW